mmetsp:Transcript_22475/g.48947  ORF Transcript_22475/g.48947 Transcript_22475/m.48947 type:complete len:204 (+) Transcript_22475:324-935(+)
MSRQRQAFFVPIQASTVQTSRVVAVRSGRRSHWLHFERLIHIFHQSLLVNAFQFRNFAFNFLGTQADLLRQKQFKFHSLARLPLQSHILSENMVILELLTRPNICRNEVGRHFYFRCFLGFLFIFVSFKDCIFWWQPTGRYGIFLAISGIAVFFLHNFHNALHANVIPNPLQRDVGVHPRNSLAIIATQQNAQIHKLIRAQIQ